MHQLYGYGYSDTDPRNFAPDYQVNTPDEIRAWKEAVACAERGEPWDDPHPPITEPITLDDGTVLPPVGRRYSGSKWGMGVTTFPDEEDED